FDDLFCSAKVDCEGEDGPLMLLFDPVTGQRRPTIVSAFACTGGPGADVATTLYRDALVLTCGSTVIPLDPSAARGNVYTDTNPDPNLTDPVWQYAIYAGEEALSCGAASCNKVYWNVAIGLDTAADGCRLTTAMTASDGPLAAFTTPANTSYPFIEVALDLTDTAGLVCSQHALNAGAEVATDYTLVTAPESFGFSFDGQSFGAASATCASPCLNGGVCTGPNTCTCVGDWQGATCDTLVCPAGTFGAAPPPGDGVCRSCTQIAHCESGLACTSAVDSSCADCEDGFEGPTCTPVQTGCDLVDEGLVFALDAANPVSYPGSGSTWTDLVRGIDCTLNGATAFDGVEDTMVFNGTTNTYAGCGTQASPQGGTTQLTVSFWVKKPSSGTDAVVSSWTHNIRTGWVLQWFSDSTLYFAVTAGGVNNNQVALPWTSGWRHVTGVFDGVGGTAINRIYIDGVEQAALSAGQLSSLPVMTADLRIGGAVNYGSLTTASIAAVTVYNRALTAAEVLQNYQAGRSACSPRALWDGSSTGVLDAVSGATAGYSVRALRAGWTDPLMRVRRADNATIDIYALASGALDTATLAAFAGTSDVFLATWYDQS
ncbi:MAG TPA: hypothetical protein PK095_06455, partial [Myxococcota bacterium]|nr:hypothetical protein [Myxococcota bacterium]